ncbi:zinc-dependent metalloprotease family protein [Nocardioides psychrotolerans]|uniref:zinc-dependent metalloprotease family protein n=1 Tax=Nocardioides psychrotolerans TaxID=1005945 RepID=UPI003137E2CE
MPQHPSRRILATVVVLTSVAAGLATLAVPASLASAPAPDATHRASASGKVYVVDPAPVGIEPPTAAPDARVASRQALRRSFTLHSKPGSQRTIFLDFDGADVSATQWNTDTGLPGGTHPAWDPAGNGPSFSAAELATVQDVWARVAEDYAPFDVDVTTADPGAAAITRAGAGDQVFGTRALITPSDAAIDAICGGGCGGVAFVDVFDEPDAHSRFQPAWIFPQALMHDPKAVAEAVSHEVGHNFGLDHDGQGGADYYAGHGSWAPIMGAGYGRPITQWSKGDYTGATRSGEDDVAIIAANGAPYRVDEDGGTRATASSALPTGAPAYISKRSDLDYYALGACAGAVTLIGTVASVSPDLDLQVQLVDDVGTVLATANPASATVDFDVVSGLGATLTQSVLSGSYFAVVDGVGNGSPSSGYDDYGSLGAYRLAVTGCGGVVVPDPEPVPPGAPGSPTATRDVAAQTLALTWTAPTTGGPVSGYEVRLDAGAWSPASGSLTHVFGAVSSAAHTLEVRALSTVGPGPAASVGVAAVVTTPGAPVIGQASPGARGGAVTALARWQPPTSTGGSAVTGYQIVAYKLTSAGAVVRTLISQVVGTSLRSRSLALPSGRYRFAVRARNAAGFGPLGMRSNAVAAR